MFIIFSGHKNHPKPPSRTPTWPEKIPPKQIKIFLDVSGFFSGQVGKRMDEIASQNVKTYLFLPGAFLTF